MIDIQKQPTEQQVKQLAEFLTDRTDYSFITFIGFITAVIGGARAIPTAEWQSCLFGKAQFNSPEEEVQIKETMMIFYHLTEQELARELYIPFTSRFDDHASLPADTLKFVYIGWLSGYCLGLTLAGNSWLNTEHFKAAGLLAPVMEICEKLDTHATYHLTREELETIQTQVKLFRDYWVEHRALHNESENVIPKNDSSTSQITY